MSNTDHPLVIIDELKLPDSLKSFDNLPNDIPIYIRKGDDYFKLTRNENLSWRISSNNIGLKVQTIDDLKNGMWHMRRPWSSQPINIINLKISGKTTSKNLNENVTLNELNINSLIKDIEKFRYQTVVIPGNITNTTFSIAGKSKQHVTLKKLKEAAEKNDINLVLLNANKKSSVKQINKSLEKNFSDDLIYDNTHDFFNRLSDGKRQINIDINRSGNSQTLIEAKISKIIPDETSSMVSLSSEAESLIDLSTHVLFHSVKIIRPDQERSKELDLRIFPNIPSSVIIYLVLSAVLGFTVLDYCKMIWNKAWLKPNKEDFKNKFYYYIYLAFYSSIFYIFFILIFGGFCFIAFCLHTLYKIFKELFRIIKKIINFIFIKPIKFFIHIMNKK